MQQGSGDASCVLNVATRCWCDSQAMALPHMSRQALAQGSTLAQAQAPALAQALRSAQAPALALTQASPSAQAQVGTAELRHWRNVEEQTALPTVPQRESPGRDQLAL